MGTAPSHGVDGRDPEFYDVDTIEDADGDAKAVSEMEVAIDEEVSAEAKRERQETTMTQKTRKQVAEERKAEKEAMKPFDLTWAFERVDHHNDKKESFLMRVKNAAGKWTDKAVSAMKLRGDSRRWSADEPKMIESWKGSFPLLPMDTISSLAGDATYDALGLRRVRNAARRCKNVLGRIGYTYPHILVITNTEPAYFHVDANGKKLLNYEAEFSRYIRMRTRGRRFVAITVLLKVERTMKVKDRFTAENTIHHNMILFDKRQKSMWWIEPHMEPWWMERTPHQILTKFQKELNFKPYLTHVKQHGVSMSGKDCYCELWCPCIAGILAGVDNDKARKSVLPRLVIPAQALMSFTYFHKDKFVEDDAIDPAKSYAFDTISINRYMGLYCIDLRHRKFLAEYDSNSDAVNKARIAFVESVKCVMNAVAKNANESNGGPTSMRRAPPVRGTRKNHVKQEGEWFFRWDEGRAWVMIEDPRLAVARDAKVAAAAADAKADKIAAALQAKLERDEVRSDARAARAIEVAMKRKARAEERANLKQVKAEEKAAREVSMLRRRTEKEAADAADRVHKEELARRKKESDEQKKVMSDMMMVLEKIQAMKDRDEEMRIARRNEDLEDEERVRKREAARLAEIAAAQRAVDEKLAAEILAEKEAEEREKEQAAKDEQDREELRRTEREAREARDRHDDTTAIRAVEEREKIDAERQRAALEARDLEHARQIRHAATDARRPHMAADDRVKAERDDRHDRVKAERDDRHDRVKTEPDATRLVDVDNSTPASPSVNAGKHRTAFATSDRSRFVRAAKDTKNTPDLDLTRRSLAAPHRRDTDRHRSLAAPRRRDTDRHRSLAAPHRMDTNRRARLLPARRRAASDRGHPMRPSPRKLRHDGNATREARRLGYQRVLRDAAENKRA